MAHLVAGGARMEAAFESELEELGTKAVEIRDKLSAGTPSAPVLGLPLARLIPQDVHTVLDYVGAATTGLAAVLADGPAATITNAALSASDAGVTMMTDVRLAPVRVIPIEVHEVIDYVWAATAIATPFLFGYAKKSPISTALQVTAGISLLLGSLLTDYRAYKGVKWGRMPRRRAANG
jgi:hypothetical protein